jgi:hypothetical protein
VREAGASLWQVQYDTFLFRYLEDTLFPLYTAHKEVAAPFCKQCIG